MPIVETILPILIIALSGYTAAYRKFLSEDECDAISKFVFTFVIPSLLFIGMAKAKIPENMSWIFFLVYYASALFIYLLNVIIGKLAFGYSNSEQSVFGMGAAFSNTTIIGIPVCVYALGEESLLPLFIIISVHMLAMFSVGILIAERSSLSLASLLGDLYKIFRSLLSNPITGSLIAGALVNLLGIPLYGPLEQGITLMSEAAIPAALFVLGASLPRYKVSGNLAPALVLVSMKLAFFPFLVWVLAFKVFSIEPLWATTALLTSAMPVGISVYVFSQKFQVCEAPVATAIIFSTVGCILTLSVLLFFI